MAALAVLLGVGCTNVVDVELPDVEAQGVLEGTVRLGEPPLILLTTTQGYFEPTTLADVAGLTVGNADVTVRVNGEAYDIPPLCSSDLPAELLDGFAESVGINPDSLGGIDFCVYLGWQDEALYGAVGNEYEVESHWEGENGQPFHLQATATMHAPPQLDSIWFEVPETSTNDSLGLIWTAFTDPPGLGNAYRWASRRTNVRYEEDGFEYALGGLYDDAFVDGQSFSFSAFRAPRGVEEEGGQGFWKVGDSVEVRLESLDYPTFLAIRDFETSVANQGNPFALPSSATSAVEGGLGWFVAYSGVTATTVCTN